jgi:hypothetical protein
MSYLGTPVFIGASADFEPLAVFVHLGQILKPLWLNCGNYYENTHF